MFEYLGFNYLSQLVLRYLSGSSQDILLVSKSTNRQIGKMFDPDLFNFAQVIYICDP